MAPGSEHPPGWTTPGLARTLRALTTGTTHLIGLLEPDGTVAYAGPSVAYLLGYAAEELIGTNVLSLLHPEDYEMALSMLAGGAAGHASGGLGWDDTDVPGEYRLRHADGRWVPFEMVRNDFAADPAIGGILIIGREVVARRALDEALTALAHDDEGTDALHKLAEYLDVRIPGTRSSFHVAGADGAWAHDGLGADLLVDIGPLPTGTADEGLVLIDLHQPDGRLPESTRREALDKGYQACWRLPIPVRRPKVYRPAGRRDLDVPVLGELVVWSSQYQVPLAAHLGVLERIGGLADVVLHRRVTTRALRHLVTHDQITGALSRTGFEELCAGGGPSTVPSTILVIDLDDFKHVNDSHGHPMGDQVLRVTAQRIQSLLRAEDILGRLGGDEFVLRVTGAELAQAESVAARILEALAAPLVIEGTTVPVRASIGIATFDPEHSEREQIARADAAMYIAKRAGKGRWHAWRGDGRAGNSPEDSTASGRHAGRHDTAS